MKVGDWVRIVDENEKGIVKEIKNNIVTIKTKDGFLEKYELKKLIVEKEDDILLSEENIFEKPIIIEKKEKKFKQNKELKIREIDLHIGQLVDFPNRLSAHQKLQKQLFIAQQEIEKAKRDQIAILILIHGKGKGTLKNAIYDILKNRDDLEFMDANIRKYRLGAVEVRFKKN